MKYKCSCDDPCEVEWHGFNEFLGSRVYKLCMEDCGNSYEWSCVTCGKVFRVAEKRSTDLLRTTPASRND